MTAARYNPERSRRGFTLIELLVVIAIISILSVVGIVAYRGVTGGARDAKRRGDIDAIVKAYETKNAAGVYQAITDADFALGKKPQDPNTAKGNYFNYLASDGSGYKVCASLDNNPNSFCNTSAANCYCKFSSQSTISSSSTADASSTNFGSGPGGSSSSCDPNGTLTAGLVGYWKMDESSWSGGSADIVDSISGKNGTAVGGANTVDSGRVGTDFNRAGSFNGSPTTVLVNNTSNSFDFDTGDFTISAWVKMPSSAPHATAIHKGDASGAFILLGQDGDNGLYPSFRVAYNHLEGGIKGEYLVNDGVWHLLVGTRSVTTINLYIDDHSPASKTNVNKDVDSDDNLDIGSMGSSFYMNGYIDDVRIYNRALSQPEITALYSGGAGCIP